MPKLHDACQIFSEEMLAGLQNLSTARAAFVLAMACHAVEEDLLFRHTDAVPIVEHLWLVLDDTIHRLRPDLAIDKDFAEQMLVFEDDMNVAFLSQYGVQIARDLFPATFHRQ